MLSLAVFLPIVCGLAMFACRGMTHRARQVLTEGVTLVTSLLVLFCLMNKRGVAYTPLYLLPKLPISFCIDGVGSVFAAIVAFLWPLATLYGFEYMEHEGGENHFFALYTMTYGVTLGIATAANVLTLYLFYEFLTLCTLPLVMHGTSKASVRAGYTYMMYSFFGAALAFVGVMLIIGFGVKAAVFPFHVWLPEASVAPTPVTALLHAVAVVKSGVFAIIRVTYFSFGAQVMRGTTAQAIALLLASATIVYGSTMAVKEHHFKRRLAYSTVSNLSYILLAACLMTQSGLTAALAHMLFHALIKITLFFCAGAVMVKTERTQIEDLRGLAKVMPFTCATYTIGAISLMGTPLLPGFVSKWLIGSAAIETGTTLGMIGVAALLISAVLTAIYLMGPAMSMYFRPLEGMEPTAKCDPGMRMKLPFAVLAAAIVLCGLFSDPIITLLAKLSAGVM